MGQWIFVDLAQSNELGVISSAVIATTLGLLIARHYAKRLESNSAYKPTLIRVLGAPISSDKLINAASKDSE
ncbi:SoxR reducing system RseC family protein [Photobacterium angustum]|uniref:SoxR reducing system RseC family protein n=1 Tax=Photobacterium angustum TaxID=661 RepID=UPI000AE5804C|nr:SoxR reducing system RseC family protein [Photobacterium angustum]